LEAVLSGADFAASRFWPAPSALGLALVLLLGPGLGGALAGLLADLGGVLGIDFWGVLAGALVVGWDTTSSFGLLPLVLAGLGLVWPEMAAFSEGLAWALAGFCLATSVGVGFGAGAVATFCLGATLPIDCGLTGVLAFGGAFAALVLPEGPGLLEDLAAGLGAALSWGLLGVAGPVRSVVRGFLGLATEPADFPTCWPLV
jgi:hypothetical protein